MKSTFLIFLIFSFSTEASAFGGNGWLTRTFKGRNSRTQTEGGLRHCTTGTCGQNNFRSPPLSPLRIPEGLGRGMQKVLTNLYGVCAAKAPLRLDRSNNNQISTFGDESQRHKRYSLTKPGEPVGDGDVYIGGIRPQTIDRGFDTIRAASPSRPVMGPYAAVARGSRVCKGHTVSVNGQRVNPANVPKMFGNGSAGRMVNGEFNIHSCGSSNYLNALNTTQRAFNCGLHASSGPAISIDCAEMIGAAAVATCKKLHPNQKFGHPSEAGGKSEGKIFIDGGQLSTRSLKENPCLKNPTVSAAAPLSSGDMFVIETHSIMITQVGNDPYGIRKANGNCNRINAAGFNFSFAQSTSHREIGPIQSTARAYENMVTGDGYKVNAFPLNHLVAMARKMCNDQKRGKAQGAASSFIQAHPAVRQMRHNASNPACSYPEGKCPKTAGSECAKQCGV